MRRLAAFALLALCGADSPDISVPAEFGLIEGVAWDEGRRQLLVGSVEDGALIVREGDRWRRATLPYRTAGLFGMAIDRNRGILWLTSGVAPMTREKNGFRGLIGVTLLGFAPVGRAAVPDAKAQPGDVAVAPDGTVFVSDGAAGGLYICKPGCEILSRFVPEGSFESPQGMAVSRDGRTLFVADYGRGLYRLDARKPKAPVLVAPVKGIDGLVRDGDALVAIVNGGGRKVLRLTMDEAGAITGQTELATLAGPGDPTLGMVSGNKLIYVADAQWDRFDKNGKATTPPRPTRLAWQSLPPGPRPSEKRVREASERRTRAPIP